MTPDQQRIATLEAALRAARLDPATYGQADEHNAAIDRALAGTVPAPQPEQLVKAALDRARGAVHDEHLNDPADCEGDKAYDMAIHHAEDALRALAADPAAVRAIVEQVKP
jgi:hypothetical protein